MSAFQFPNTQQLFQLPQGQVVLPQMYQGQQQQLLHNNALQLAQLQALQSGQLGSLPQNLQLVGQQQSLSAATAITNAGTAESQNSVHSIPCSDNAS